MAAEINIDVGYNEINVAFGRTDPTVVAGSTGLYEASFDYSDFSGGEVELGSITNGTWVLAAFVLVTEAFDGGALLTIGDDVAEGRLVVAADIELSTEGVYTVETVFKYPVSTIVKGYFAGSPIQGSGKIIIIFVE